MSDTLYMPDLASDSRSIAVANIPIRTTVCKCVAKKNYSYLGWFAVASVTIWFFSTVQMFNSKITNYTLKAV